MNMNGAFACASFVFATAPALACDITIDPKPSWEEMIDESDIVFVGRVIAVSPADDDALAGRALFQVEMAVKGEVAGQFDFEMGTSSCDASFRVGSYVIFAATSHVSDGGRFIWVRDSGWDPTVFLSDPPTPDQQAKLDYLKTINEIR